MTSTSRAKPFYGPINPAILGAFEWEDDEPTGQTAAGHTTGVNLLRYLPFNPALLGGFDDRDQSAASTTATDRGRDRVEEVPNPVEPVTTTTKSHSPLRGSRRFLARVLSSAVGNGEPRTRGVRKRQETSPKARRRESSTTHTESDISTNPHTAVIEDKQNSVTVAFLRDQEAVSPVDVSCSLSPDDLSLGQRYQVTEETATVVITNQRKLPDVLSGDRECIICTDTKPASEFPAIAITAACDHTPTTCLVCIATSIRTDLSSRLWNEIKCPECRATLQYDDVQRFADDGAKERYQTLSFRSALSLSPTFLWCTSGCGYGQVHEGGLAQPIVTCLLCHHRSCFHHKVAWHENLTCDEYDALLTDPANFRSRFDIENEEAEKAAAARRAQEDADRVFAQGLVAREQRAVVEERERKERERREAAERREREERERRERAEREERERREREVREEMMRRKKEEEASQRTVEGTTKPCPGCSAPIEKNAGCAHMTCTRCQHGFCWDCLADHKQILESDNTAHKKECPWHPDNIKDDVGS